MFLVILVTNGYYGELVVYLVVLVVIGCVLGYLVMLVVYWLFIWSKRVCRVLVECVRDQFPFKKTQYSVRVVGRVKYLLQRS